MRHAPLFPSGGYKDKLRLVSVVPLSFPLLCSCSLSVFFCWIIITEQLWPLPVLATALHKHGLEHFKHESQAVTRCTRSVNPASLFAHSECELRSWVLCHGISLISTQRHLCSATEPKSFSRLPRWGWIRPFLTKSDPRGWQRAKEKKLFCSRTGHFVIEHHSSSTTAHLPIMLRSTSLWTQN